ncbi:sugar-binding transcriptional regulator [Anaerosalibacter bizertensis]|uniref:Sugar-binding transcriptional regulator n=1 Tax=Anaerosalibacter bizertensis TaxID=932217 RepID=A0A844FDW4_9FIRM|nr:sugar-binding transcriptional regulator [Anaerosalibacter bizertensis]
MKKIIELEKKIAPELIDILENRYDILRNIYYNQPIGRRSLANQLGMGERTIRTEVNILKNQGLLNIESMGMYVTNEGKVLLEDIKDLIHIIKGLTELESALENKLNIRKVLVVPGNSDESKLVLKDMGRTAARFLKKMIKKNSIIGITGGTTMAQVAEEMPKGKVANDILVLPARGGLGKDVETQANSIAANLAKKLDGNYRLLHVPDNIEQEAINALLKVSEVKEFVDIIKKLDILVFGIGRADVMAERRKVSEETIEELIDRGAVAEAFGHYFDTNGNRVWESITVGLSLVDFKKVNNVIGVAGGEKKAEAIISISSIREDMILVTDEGAARKILKLVN